jgi:hypothetical protein
MIKRLRVLDFKKGNDGKAAFNPSYLRLLPVTYIA